MKSTFGFLLTIGVLLAPKALAFVFPAVLPRLILSHRFSDVVEGDVEVVAPAPVTEVSRLEIRVGKIVQVDGHPTLPKIFVEKIDLGEAEGPRTICSGLQGFLTKEDLLGKACLVLANLKPRDLEGTPSNGMVLCASNKDHSEVRLVSPPDGVAVGELVTFAGHASEPAEAGNRAVKSWKKVGGSFATDAGGVAWYMGADAPAKMNTSAGPCTAVIKDGPIG